MNLWSWCSNFRCLIDGRRENKGKLRRLWTMRDNAGVTLDGRQPPAMCGRCNIHRMFVATDDRRQRVGLIQNDRLFDTYACRTFLPSLPSSPSTSGRNRNRRPICLTCRPLRILLWLTAIVLVGEGREWAVNGVCATGRVWTDDAGSRGQCVGD